MLRDFAGTIPAEMLPGRNAPQKENSMFNSPIVKTVLTVLVVIAFCKLFANKIPVVGKFISIG